MSQNGHIGVKGLELGPIVTATCTEQEKLGWAIINRPDKSQTPSQYLDLLLTAKLLLQ